MSMDLEKLLTALKRETDHCEIFLHETQSLSMSMEQGSPKMSTTTRDSGLAVRVLKEGKLGFAVFSLPVEPNEVVKSVVEVAEIGKTTNLAFAPPPLQGYPEAPGIPEEVDDLAATEEVTDRSMAVLTRASEKIKKYDANVIGKASIGREIHRVRILNSLGVNVGYAKTLHTFGVVGTITENHSTFHWVRGYNKTSPDFDADAITESLIQECRIGRPVATIKSSVMPVVLDPCATADVITCFLAGINGTSVARGFSPLVGKRGEQIFNDKLTIVDDPFFLDAIDTAPTDDEGTPCSRTVLVENGVLRNYLTDLKSAADLGELPSTGNGLRNKSLMGWKEYSVVPHPKATTLVIEAGDVSYQDMLADLDEGLLIYTVPDVFQGNIINGNFTGSIFFGLLYRKGKPVGRVNGAGISGNIYDVFKDNLVALSKEEDFANMHSNMVAPHIFLKDINVIAQ